MKDGGELVALLRQIAAIDFRTDAIPAHLLDTVGEAADALSQANARADAAEAENTRLRAALAQSELALCVLTLLLPKAGWAEVPTRHSLGCDRRR
jgi:hypothetical protein